MVAPIGGCRRCSGANCNNSSYCPFIRASSWPPAATPRATSNPQPAANVYIRLAEGGAATHTQARPRPNPGPTQAQPRPNPGPTTTARAEYLPKPQVLKAPRSPGTTASLPLSTVALDKVLDKAPPPPLFHSNDSGPPRGVLQLGHLAYTPSHYPNKNRAHPVEVRRVPNIACGLAWVDCPVFFSFFFLFIKKIAYPYKR